MLGNTRGYHLNLRRLPLPVTVAFITFRLPSNSGKYIVFFLGVGWGIPEHVVTDPLPMFGGWLENFQLSRLCLVRDLQYGVPGGKAGKSCKLEQGIKLIYKPGSGCMYIYICIVYIYIIRFCMYYVISHLLFCILFTFVF